MTTEFLIGSRHIGDRSALSAGGGGGEVPAAAVAAASVFQEE